MICSLRSFSQTPEGGVSALVDAAPDGNGGGGNIYRLTCAEVHLHAHLLLAGPPCSPLPMFPQLQSRPLPSLTLLPSPPCNAPGQYLVAADGVRSSVRQQLGIGQGGPGAIQHLINIHFVSPQLGRLLQERRQEGMLYFVFNRDVIAVVVAHNISEGEFVAQVSSIALLTL